MLIATKIEIFERTGYRRRMMRGLRDGRELFWVVKTRTTRLPGADIIEIPEMTAAFDRKAGRFLRDEADRPIPLCRMTIRDGRFSTESYPDRRARALASEERVVRRTQTQARAEAEARAGCGAGGRAGFGGAP